MGGGCISHFPAVPLSHNCSFLLNPYTSPSPHPILLSSSVLRHPPFCASFDSGETRVKEKRKKKKKKGRGRPFVRTSKQSHARIQLPHIHINALICTNKHTLTHTTDDTSFSPHSRRISSPLFFCPSGPIFLPQNTHPPSPSILPPSSFFPPSPSPGCSLSTAPRIDFAISGVPFATG